MSISIENLTEFDNHKLVVAFFDRDTGLRGHIAIHSTRSGLAVGGTRLLPYDSDTEALEDVLRLSKAMSYKCALSGLPYGGGKAVIISGPNQSRADMLRAYGRVIEQLGGLFKTGTDVGITDRDVSLLATTTRHMIGAQTLEDPGFPTTAEMAALGVFYAIEASLQHKFGSASVHGRRIGIKGVGKLGGHLAKLLHEGGARLVIGDIDNARTGALKERYRDIEVIAPSDVHLQELDVYAPCALGHEFTLNTVQALRTGIIAGGANNQLANAESGERLHEQGILYAPDYIANAGGLIHVTGELEPGGYDRSVVEDRVRGIAKTLTTVFEESDRTNRPTSLVADELGQRLITES